jgi:hypothetical protein
MPTYYFDVREEGVVRADDEGLEMPDYAAAEREATETVAALAHDRFCEGREQAIVIDVRDEEGERVLSVTASLSIVRSGARLN